MPRCSAQGAARAGYWRSVGDEKLLRLMNGRKADVLAIGWTTDGLQQLFARPTEPWASAATGAARFDRSGH